MTITGGCRCGAVRYRIEAETITTRHCWCRDCQFIGAGSGTVILPERGREGRGRSIRLYEPRRER